MKKNSKIRKVILMTLILLSFILSGLLWTAGNPLSDVMEEKSKNSQIMANQAVPSIVHRELMDFYQPIQYIVHNTGDQGIGHAIMSNKKQNEIDQIFLESEFERFLETRKMTHSEYADLIQSERWLELVYDDVLPAGLLKERFTNLSKDWNEYSFDRILVSRDDPVTIWIYNYQEEMAARIQVIKFETPLLENVIVEAEKESISVFNATLKNNNVYLPVNEQEILRKNYIVEKLPNSIYISYFFPDTAMVDSRTTKNITRYIDLTKEVSINQETNMLTYLSQKEIIDTASLTDRFIQSYEYLNDIDNWQNDVIYHAYQPETERLSFLRYIDEYPVISTPNVESIIEIGVKAGQLTHLQLPLRFIQTPITMQKTMNEKMMSGFEVLDTLRENNIVVTDDIENIIIGYTWQEHEENEKVIELKPEWYVYTENQWFPLEKYLNHHIGGGLSYEF